MLGLGPVYTAIRGEAGTWPWLFAERQDGVKTENPHCVGGPHGFRYHTCPIWRFNPKQVT